MTSAGYCVTTNLRKDFVMNIMNITLIPGDEKEKRQHINTIHSISRETGITEENVSLLYEVILERYMSDARIKVYLPILVSREVKEMLLNIKR